ncbi:tail fiber protein [Escherichia coli]|nr:tail fiber protein [Escherichia coli]
MSQAVITKAFTEWKAQQAINNQPVTLDEFIFAYIPGLDADKPIDNTETAPAADKIVYRQVLSKSGVVNENSVVYSVTMGADVGDFDFNWIGLANKATGTLAMIIHAPTQRKIKNANGQQGNVLVRSMLMEYSGAREATEITTPAETWQIDFTARLAAMDERQRRENIDLYGAASFFDAGYLVAKTGTQYFVTKGTGYLAGLRSVLAANQNITVSTKPVKVWLDVAWMGTLTSIWAVQSKITVAADLKDYVQNGEQHFVFALASIDANGVITDLRPKGTLNEQQASDALKKHEQSRNHPDATTTAKGFTQLSSATDSDSEEVAATPKAVKATYDLAKGKYTAQDATTAQKGLIQLSSATDSESEAVAATPKAVKAANDNANSRVPSTRTVNGRALSSNIDLFPSDIFRLAEGIGNAANLNNYTTPGLYYQPANAQAQTGTNYPEAIAGSLEVLKHAGITQIYRVYNNSRSYARTLYGGTWSAWTKAYDVANKPTPAEIGALASNGNAVSASQLQTARTINGVAFNGTANITISAGSIGSYTKAESDARYNLKNTASLGQNGWERDGTTGRIRQWGYTNQTSGYQNITFPIAFPNACRNIQVTPFTSNVAGTLECSVSQYSNTTARLNANQGFPLFWLATGY